MIATDDRERTLRETAEQIGKEYIEGDYPGEDSPEVRAAYRKIARINGVLFEQLPVCVEFTEGDPYDSHAEMCEAVDRTGVLTIFTGGSHPPGVTREENIKGRAVHDYLGHYCQDVDFSFAGEFRKWDAQKRHYPEECWPLLFTDVVGQVSAAYYLDGGFDNPRFEQRALFAPDHWQDMAREVVERQG